ncbi:ABC efflux pump, inner membrane subunit [Candidatus Zixiibacteriota bacterium]|nr:ABC efflux pump, inner membrane subunit [candidate division Zixibacteria bacterium]
MNSVEMKEGVIMAMNSLLSNKFRSALTILGVLIGVWSVIAMTSLIRGLDNAVQSSITDLGSNIIFVDTFPPNTDWDELTDEERNRKDITVYEAEAISESCPAVTAVSPENHYYPPGGNTVKYQGRKANRPVVIGVVPDFLKVRSNTVEAGRFFTKLDNDNRMMFCLLGSDVKEALFPGEDPIDKQIRLNNERFTVIGTFAKIKSLFGDNDNNNVYIPLETYMKLYPWDTALTLAVSAASMAQVEQAKEEITVALRKARKVPYDKENDFAVFGQENLREMVGNITKYIYIAMIVISSVGLMVGGVGVMNIMLVSVTERTREIGVRKAIGARRNNILWQFLIEAMTLSGTGGVLGIGVGLMTSLLIGMLTPLPFGVSGLYVFLGFLVAVSVGLIAGIYPAYRAARVDPIESLRYE